MTGLQVLGTVVVVASLVGLICGGVGYFSAIVDLQEAERRAWEVGFRRGIEYEKTRVEEASKGLALFPSSAIANPYATKLRRPFLRRTKADVPHV